MAPDLYFLARVGRPRFATDLVRDLSATGEITTAQFRDRHKTSRKYAIPLLEYFDRTGVTVRIGEMRRLRDPQTEPETHERSRNTTLVKRAGRKALAKALGLTQQVAAAG